MKSCFSFSLFVLFLIQSCGFGNQNQTVNSDGSSSLISYDDSPFVFNTSKINHIDSICLATNKAMFHKPKLNHLDVSHFGQPNLKIGYYTDPESDITRILISENESRVLNIKYIFYKNDIPIQIHSRYWDKNPSPQLTKETYMYFDDKGKMFYAGERSADIYEGEIPAKLKSIDLEIPAKSKKELLEFVLKYWNMAKPLVDEDRALKAEAEISQ